MLSTNEIEFILYSFVVLIIIGVLLSLLTQATQKEVGSVQLRLEQTLPGINCGQCGFPSCSAYAQALSAGKASATLCRPGGPEMAATLCSMLGQVVQSGQDYDEAIFTPKLVALIHTSLCNGCGKCAKKCKIDCIVGKIKQPFEVDPTYCIGCAKCVPLCANKAIEMVREEASIEHFDWNIKAVKITTGGNN